MEQTAPQQTTERYIKVATNEKRSTPSGKSIWDIQDHNDVTYSSWSETLAGLLAPGTETDVRFTTVKNGKFTNRTISAVKDTKGQWQESEAKKSYNGKGGSTFDPALSKKQTCLNAAALVVANTYGTGDFNAKIIGQAVLQVATQLETFFQANSTPVNALTNGKKELEAVA